MELNSLQDVKKWLTTNGVKATPSQIDRGASNCLNCNTRLVAPDDCFLAGKQAAYIYIKDLINSAEKQIEKSRSKNNSIAVVLTGQAAEDMSEWLEIEKLAIAEVKRICKETHI